MGASTASFFPNHLKKCVEQLFSVSRTLHYHPSADLMILFQNLFHLYDVFVHFVIEMLLRETPLIR